MNTITALFALLSELLLVPVVVALLALLAATCLATGMHLAEALERRRDARRLGGHLDALRGIDVAARRQAWVALGATPAHGNLGRFLRGAAALEGQPLALAALLDEIDAVIAARIARVTLLARLGPALGLMGTLIPMGSVLGAVASGEVRTMASQLVLAFTTTVVGLAISVVATIIVTARRRWYADDANRLERLADAIAEGPST